MRSVYRHAAWAFWLMSSVGLVSLTHAQGVSYMDQISAYRNDFKPVDSGPTNTSFIANLAVSQVRRIVERGDTGNAGGNVTTLARDGVLSNGGLTTGGGFNFASPVITGTVRGNVTVVVQKGAVKGDITSIQP